MTSACHRLLHRLFEEQAGKSPDAVALHEGEQCITFRELDQRATRLALGLREQGIGDGDLVGLHIDRSIAWVVATLGILKARAAVVPLPPAFPAERLRDVSSHAGLKLVIDCPDTPLDPLPGTRVSPLDTLLSGNPQPDRLADRGQTATAFVLCSSGSTGRPKMIVRSHESFLHRLYWTWENHPFAAGELCCHKAPVTTTHSVYELFEPLLRGVPVLIVPEKDARNLEDFWRRIAARGVTRLLIVPSALHASLQIPGFKAPPIRVMVLMGESVDARLAERALAAFPESSIYSIYGSTEASSILVCDVRRCWRPGAELPLGRPIADSVEILVLGRDAKPVPHGEIGRLYVAGPPLFDEYFCDRQLTASVLARVPGRSARFYDTHDRVRLLPDGTPIFAGRVDNTVKVRGFRVDLQEVENALLAHEGIARAAVVVDESKTGSTSLAAFFIPANVDRAGVFATLRARLPDYMIPSVLLGLDKFPATARGKLDKARLLADYRRPKPGASAPGALSDTERIVFACYSRVLGHERFGLDDSFFEAGGTSLLVFSLVHDLRIGLEMDERSLSVQSVYSHPTVASLARHIADRQSGALAAHEEDVVPLLVSLGKAADPALTPFFLIASAGGTLGAYGKLVTALSIPREIVGIQDPFVLRDNGRDPTEDFQQWVGRYLAAIRSRQASGPYCLGAYSSAGAFAYEIACRLRDEGENVERLVLIDPLSLDCTDRYRYGWWALRATYSGALLRNLVRLAGWLRGAWRPGGTRAANPVATGNRHAIGAEDYRRLQRGQLQSKNALIQFAALIELNSGLPFALSESDFAEKRPEQFIDVLNAQFAKLMPDVDQEAVVRILTQYQLQIRAQHAYRLRPYDGPTVLIEPASRHAGLLRALLTPYTTRLCARTIALGNTPPAAAYNFGTLDAHFRCMREDSFVGELAEYLDSLLR